MVTCWILLWWDRTTNLYPILFLALVSTESEVVVGYTEIQIPTYQVDIQHHEFDGCRYKLVTSRQVFTKTFLKQPIQNTVESLSDQYNFADSKKHNLVRPSDLSALRMTLLGQKLQTIV